MQRCLSLLIWALRLVGGRLRACEQGLHQFWVFSLQLAQDRGPLRISRTSPGAGQEHADFRVKLDSGEVCWQWHIALNSSSRRGVREKPRHIQCA